MFHLRLFTILLLTLLTTASFGQTKWSPPRTADGYPDLQGVWTNATLTPLQRPPELAGTQIFSDAQALAYDKQRLDAMNVDSPGARRAGDPGSYNQAFWDRGTHIVRSHRTSLVVDPPDGKIPPMTAGAQARFERIHDERFRHPSDGPEDRNLSERCIWFSGDGPPFLPEPYNNNYQVLQTADHIAILAEMNHEWRVIPTKPLQPPTQIQQWKGFSAGHWEGDSLVVETISLKANDQSRFGVVYDGMTDENLRVTERFTRDAPDHITYRATVSDPTVYTKPWTVEMSMIRTKGPVYEYACHEGNYGMQGILQGARAQEKK
jgi:hypothetical protein